MQTDAKQNFANAMLGLAKDFTDVMNDYAAKKKQYNAVFQGDNAIIAGDDFGNGITGTDILGVITALDAVETNATTNFLYTNLYNVQ